MEEVAALTVGAKALAGEGVARSSLVGHVVIGVALELEGAVGELALGAVGAVALLHEVSAQRAFGLMVGSLCVARLPPHLVAVGVVAHLATLGGGLG